VLPSDGCDPGALFLTALSIQLVGVVGLQHPSFPSMATPASAPAADPLASIPSNTVSYDIGVTGHSAGKEYEVVIVNVVGGYRPSYLNAFMIISTVQKWVHVTNIQLKTGDPLAAPATAISSATRRPLRPHLVEALHVPQFGLWAIDATPYGLLWDRQ